MTISKIDPAGLDVGQIGGRRNLIINGAMQVAQRGTSVTGLADSPVFLVDRFSYRRAGDWTTYSGTMTQETVTDLAGFQHSVRLTTATSETSGGDSNGINYAAEGQDVQALQYGYSSAKSCTLSFWVKSSNTGNFGISIDVTDMTAPFYHTSYSISSADTWEYKTIVIPPASTSEKIDNDNTSSFGVYWITSTLSSTTTADEWNTNGVWDGHSSIVDLAATTDAYLEITGVQLEVGTVATPFEHRSFGEELALCQRYYQKSYNYGTALGTATAVGCVYGRNYDPNSSRTVNIAPVKFPVQMRTNTWSTSVYSLNGDVGNVSDCGISIGHNSNVSFSNFSNTGGETGFSSTTTGSIPASSLFAFHYALDNEV